MRKLLIIACLLAFPAIIIGCGAKKEDDGASTAPKITGTFNNNAPGANEAPAAPGPDPGTPRPGGKRPPPK